MEFARISKWLEERARSWQSKIPRSSAGIWALQNNFKESGKVKQQRLMIITQELSMLQIRADHDGWLQKEHAGLRVIKWTKQGTYESWGRFQQEKKNPNWYLPAHTQPFLNTCRRHKARHPAQEDYRRFCSSLLHQELLHSSGANVQPCWAPHQSSVLDMKWFFLLQLFYFIGEIVAWFQMSHFYLSPSFPWLFKEVWQQFETFISQLFLKHVTRAGLSCVMSVFFIYSHSLRFNQELFITNFL